MSRVRENRMHGSMGGSWNRSVATVNRTWAPGGNAGAVRRGLPPFNATAPAPYPTATIGSEWAPVCIQTGGQMDWLTLAVPAVFTTIGGLVVWYFQSRAENLRRLEESLQES